ncbi:MAG TPA: peptidylprolyl isomerase [Nitriliruptorales bacterium]|nr:peptidylprolyl isomerase [Nitriliruptorales bacterium]
MAKRKRRAHQRSLERARARREQARAATRRRRAAIGIGGVLVVVVVIAMVASLLPRRSSVEVDNPLAATPTPTAGAAVACSAQPPAPTGQRPRFDAPPEQQLQAGVDYRATMVTSCGDIVVDLYEDRAPLTVNNFVFLAEQGFYDGIVFHRVVPGFVIQGGAPEGTGSGGPGYRFADELDLAREQGYRTGSMAMANSGPDTNGSQFFVVLEGGAQRLQPRFNLFGQVVDGMDAAQRIASVPLAGQSPMERIYIEQVRIDRGPAPAPHQPTTAGGMP